MYVCMFYICAQTHIEWVKLDIQLSYKMHYIDKHFKVLDNEEVFFHTRVYNNSS